MASLDGTDVHLEAPSRPSSYLELVEIAKSVRAEINRQIRTVMEVDWDDSFDQVFGPEQIEHRLRAGLVYPLVIEGSALGPPLLALVSPFESWEGSSSNLLKALKARVDKEDRRGPSWPKTPRELASELDRLTPALRGIGVVVSFRMRGRGRLITVERSLPERRNLPNREGRLLEEAGSGQGGASAPLAVEEGPCSPGESLHGSRTVPNVDQPTGAWLQRLNLADLPERFWKEYDAYLAEYGHRPTREDLAGRFHVSRSTLIRALNRCGINVPRGQPRMKADTP